MIHVDTHVLVWLWDRKAKYAKILARRIDGEDVALSPAVLLEGDQRFGSAMPIRSVSAALVK